MVDGSCLHMQVLNFIHNIVCSSCLNIDAVSFFECLDSKGCISAANDSYSLLVV